MKESLVPNSGLQPREDLPEVHCGSCARARSHTHTDRERERERDDKERPRNNRANKASEFCALPAIGTESEREREGGTNQVDARVQGNAEMHDTLSGSGRTKIIAWEAYGQGDCHRIQQTLSVQNCVTSRIRFRTWIYRHATHYPQSTPANIIFCSFCLLLSFLLLCNSRAY
jgi:hypothetical protein